MTGNMNPHDMMRVNMVKGRIGSKKNVKMGAGHLGHAGGMHHRHHGPPGMGNPMGAGGTMPGSAPPMGAGPTMPTMGGF